MATGTLVDPHFTHPDWDEVLARYDAARLPFFHPEEQTPLYAQMRAQVEASNTDRALLSAMSRQHYGRFLMMEQAWTALHRPAPWHGLLT